MRRNWRHWSAPLAATAPLDDSQFGFNITWASDQTVVVEACTNLSDSNWQAVQTNALTAGSYYFSDPQWTNSPCRFYRIGSP